ncbi:glycosyltransferase family 4 protein [Labilibacter marinus]|uniref:glycosyltransferase family 4 protein n=1 Tax=Labilibacter marinus TaxID=1477105 RepID=UPI00094FF9CE|nr:glycosyltransferase family 4 protein [Labilibacter marinus]
MKVLIINKSASNGGAAVAARRLFNALKSNGTDVKMLVEDCSDTAQDIACVANNKVKRRASFKRFVYERLYFLPFERNKSVRFQFSPAVAGLDLSNHPWVQEADIIHLHWFNQGFISLKGLDKLFQLNKPIVWTLHDMWSFTGGCHYSGSCSEYVEHCGHCPFLRYRHNTDLSYTIHQRKKKIWKKAEMHAVTCSKWLGSLAKESTLLRGKKISAIPNPIDSELFKPIDQLETRKKLGLPLDKKLLLFGAANINDPRKGIKYLVHALEILEIKQPELKSKFELVVFGKSNKAFLKNIPFKIHEMNFISNNEELVRLYNAADAFILPSLQDNLPNTVMESLSCGTPVISFKIGGVPEMISHRKTGYLADAKNSDHLSKGIYITLFKSHNEKMQQDAREFVLNNYSNQIIAEQYQNVYTSLV